MRKNFFRTLTAAAVMACLMTVPAYAESATVTGDYVNIRTGPGIGYGVVECLRRGAQLTVTDRSNSSWYAVEYDGLSGFMASGYLTVTEEEVYVETPVYSDAEGTVAHINAMYVRFRSGPGSAYSVLSEYNKGKSLTVTGTYGDWYACIIDGRSGYVHSDYVSEGRYSAPSNSYAGSGDIYLDSYIPSTEDEYLVAVPTERPVEIPVPVVTPAPVYTPVPVETPVPVPTQVPVPTATPVPVETPEATPVPTPTPAAPEVQQRTRGFINANYVRFRTGPSTSHSIIDSYNKGTSLVILSAADGWTACEINGISGYVFSQYVTEQLQAGVTPPQTAEPEQKPVETPEATLIPTPVPTPEVEQVEQTAGYVSGNSVRMREGASMSSGIICELNFGNKVTITGYSGDWTAVVYEGTAGYIYSQYVQEGEYSVPVVPNAPEHGGNSSELGAQIADYALQFVGYNYSWGGKSPDTGFDCSGLVYYVYQQFGYTLNRVAADQALNGVHVDDLQPGDVLCFYSGSSYIGHSGIYIGGGKFVHAANSATGVIVSSLDGYYNTRGYEARRIV